MATRTRAEPRCNLTLTRNEWAVLVRLLDGVSGPMSISVRQAIRAALNAEPDAASVSIDRESDKWTGVVQAVWKDAMRRKAEYLDVVHRMTVQISASNTDNW